MTHTKSRNLKRHEYISGYPDQGIRCNIWKTDYPVSINRSVH